MSHVNMGMIGAAVLILLGMTVFQFAEIDMRNDTIETLDAQLEELREQLKVSAEEFIECTDILVECKEELEKNIHTIQCDPMTFDRMPERGLI